MGLKNLTESQLIRYATYASVAVAGLLIVLKLFAWMMTHSISLQASLIDSLLDAFASLINMIAVAHALKPADAEHRFGHGKVESLAALGQALFIGGSSLWLLHEAWNRFLLREPIESTEIGIVVMVVAIGITLILVAYQNYVVKLTKSSAIGADMLHYKSDLMINAAVIVSLLVVDVLHVDFIDPVFGVLIGMYILWTAWKIILQAFNILMDRELDEEERKQILKIIGNHLEVQGVRDLRTRSSGLHQFFQLQLVLNPHISLEDANHVVEEVEREIIKVFPKSQVMIRLLPNLSAEGKQRKS